MDILASLLAGLDVGERIRREVDRAAASSGFSAAQMRILRELSGEGQLTHRKLTERTGYVGSQISREVKDLADRALIAAAPSQYHLRQKLLSLTPDGEAAALAVSRARVNAFSEVFAKLTPAEQSALSPSRRHVPSTLQISPASQLDVIDAFHAALHDVRSSYEFSELPPQFLIQATHLLAAVFDPWDSSHSGFVVRDRGELVGFCLMRLGADLKTSDDASTLFIVGPFVRRDFRGVEIGSKLLDACLKQAEDSDMISVATTVSSQTPAVAKLFTRRGFRRLKGVDWSDLLAPMEHRIKLFSKSFVQST